MWPAVYGPALAVIEAFEVEAYRGRIQFRHPCQTLSFKEKAKGAEQAPSWNDVRLEHFSHVCNKEMYVIMF